MSDFTDRIETLLLAKGIKKSEFTDANGIHLQSFYDWKKRGTIPSADVAVKIASYLGTSVEWLVTGTESTPESAATIENTALKDKLARIVKIARE